MVLKSKAPDLPIENDTRDRLACPLGGYPSLPYALIMTDAAPYEWETVYTVHEYFDGPRNGVAQYRGQPHAYRCEWDHSADEWGTEFLLSPIAPEQLSATEELWSIWERYLATARQGALGPGDRHPALASDRARYEQLHSVIDQALQVDEAMALRAVPVFRRSNEDYDAFEVRWTPIAT